jgi:hypothetical protein
MSQDFGVDRSGNNNHWSVNNMTYSDQVVDSPTNNFCTWNPLMDMWSTHSEGNLKIVTGSGSDRWKRNATSSFLLPESGKWYWENVVVAVGEIGIGVTIGYGGFDDQHPAKSRYYHGGGADGGYQIEGSNVSTAPASYTNDDIIAVAYNADDNEITWYKNNVSQGTENLTATKKPLIAFNQQNSSGGTCTFIANFGQDSSFAGNKTAQGNQDGNDIGDFYYTPPTGFLALCTSNLPDVDVVPSEHFNTVLWSGSGSSQSITGVGFQPDWLWIKMRSSAYNHRFFDAIRGSANGLYSPNTNVEGDYSAYDGVTSFDTDGFSLSGKDGTDKSGETYVAWNWKANGSGSSNTDGSITSTVSANTDAGFSIVSYTGTGSNATVGHGLSVAPETIMIKKRSATQNWVNYHKGIGATGGVYLNDTDATITASNFFQDTSPTSSVFSIGDGNGVNTDTETFIAYCFHSVDGYSKVGSYEGNGDDDGTFVYTGFNVKWLLIKNIDATQNWYAFDSARDALNPITNPLSPNTSGTEDTASCDFLSNGFKMRDDDGAWNGANTYIYIAFAETPFKYSNAR